MSPPWRPLAFLLTALGAALCVSCSAARSDSADSTLVDAEPALEPGLVRLSEAAARFVTVAPVRVDPEVSATLAAPMRVVLRDQALARVGTPVSGRVTEVHVVMGDVVEVGAPLVTLRSPDAAAARAALRASLAALAAAQAEAERVARLREHGVGTTREQLEIDLRNAELRAEVARARTTVDYVGRGTGATVVVRAPIAGTVIARNVGPGATVDPAGEPLLELGDPSALWVEADVFERDLAEIHVGASAEVQVPGHTHTLHGVVVSVGAVVRAGTRTAPVRIEVTDATGLRPGVFGRATIALGPQGLTLPTEAVLIDEGRQYVVFVARDTQTFERRPVEIGMHLNGRVQVTAGLRDGEVVVTRGALLVDGAADALL